MSHFNVKTLSFYSIAIGSVLLLFKVVSTYGETKLNAAPNIDGSYQFLQAQDLPDCLQGQQLKLNIEQSGIYLFGNLEVALLGKTTGVYDNRAVQLQSKPGSVVKIPLSGDLKDHQVIMSGKGNVPGCEAQLQLAIQGKHENHNLVGQIKDNLSQTEGTFSAKYSKSGSGSAASATGH
jgi:hypothetical protein